MCGLGQTAPNPVLSTIKYFREEYQSILVKYCRAGVCSELFISPRENSCLQCKYTTYFTDCFTFYDACITRKIFCCGGELCSSCENRCRRSAVDEAVQFAPAICFRLHETKMSMILYTENGQKVAIIGAERQG